MTCLQHVLMKQKLTITVRPHVSGKKGARKANVSKKFPFSGQYSCGEMKTEIV